MSIAAFNVRHSFTHAHMHDLVFAMSSFAAHSDLRIFQFWNVSTPIVHEGLEQADRHSTDHFDKIITYICTVSIQ